VRDKQYKDMKEITDYKIIFDSDVEHLITRMNIYIQNEGWQPLGGMVVSNMREGTEYFYQTMVKY
jgi:hypothetical protein